MTFEVKTNNVPRDIVAGYDLSPEERAQFSHYNDEQIQEQEFFRYRGNLHDLAEFDVTDHAGVPESHSMKLADLGWQGYMPDGYFCGVVVRYVDQFERVVVGTYSC